MPHRSEQYKKRLDQLIQAIVEVAEGNYEVEVPTSAENDELEAIAMGFNIMVEEIKEKERLAEQTESKFKKLLETTTDAIVIANEDLKIVSWNYGARAIFGFEEAEIKTRSIMNIIPKEHRDAFRKVIDIMNREPVLWVSRQATELEGLHKNGTIFPMEFSLNSWKSDGKKFYCSIIRDISDRKKAEIELKESEAKYRSLIEHMNDGVINVDNKGKILFVNKRFCEMTGYTEADLVGNIANEIFLRKDSRAYKKMKEVIKMRKKGVSSVLELPMKTKSGKIKWMLNSGAPLYNSAGEVIGSVGIVADIHDLKSAQQKILEKNRELSTFIYRASHDLKGPLSSTKGVVQLARRELEKDAEVIKYMDMIDQSVSRLDETLTDLIGLARLSEKKPEKKEVNLEEEVDSIIKDAQRLKNYNRVKVLSNVQLKTFNSDRGMVRSILQNLIDNAIKYHKVNIPDAYVEITITDKGKELEIAVIDNGPGMEEEVQRKVFDMFYRGSYESDGTGLGLYLVKRSVEKLGGELSMSSAPGKGTAFHVSLPK